MKKAIKKINFRSTRNKSPEHVADALGPVAARIYRALVSAKNGMTYYDAEKKFGLYGGTSSARLSQMHDCGFVSTCGTRKARRGSATVYVVS